MVVEWWWNGGGMLWDAGGMPVGCRWDAGGMPMGCRWILMQYWDTSTVSCPFFSALTVLSAERLEPFTRMLTPHSPKDPLHGLRERDVIQRR